MLYAHLGHMGLLEPIPTVKGQEAGYTTDRMPAYHDSANNCYHYASPQTIIYNIPNIGPK